MKPITLAKSSASGELNAATRKGYILLTRSGKPIAYVLPTAYYDEEDIGYMTDPEFWKEVRRWREQKGPSVPLEEVEARLAAREAAEAGSKAKLRSKNGKKGKRNAAA